MTMRFLNADYLRIAGYDKDGKIPVSDEARNRYGGTKYDGSRKGEFAVLSGGANNLDRQRKELNMGAGAMFAQYFTMGPDGKKIPYHGEIPTDDGVSIFADNEGYYRKVDLGYVEEERKRIEQQENYAKKILDYVSLNNEMFELFMGMKVDKVGPDQDAGVKMSAEMKAIDAKPSSINLLPEAHPSRVAAYSKLFHVIKHRPCMLVNASHKADIEENA